MRIKIRSLILVVPLLLCASFVMAYEENEVIIITNSETVKETREIVDYVRENGGEISQVFIPDVIIGKLSAELQNDILTKYTGKIITISGNQIDISQFIGSQAEAGIRYWNSRFVLESQAVALTRPDLPPLLNDALVPLDRKNESERISGAASLPPSDRETSEYMYGDVLASIILLESDGSFDSSTEDWTATEEANVDQEIAEGLSWWTSRKPSNVDLTFWVYANHYKIPTRYEPINRPQSDEGLWINEAMDYFGIPGGSYFSRTRAYADEIRDVNDLDWAFSIFVVDSSNDVDGSFTDDYSAYAYLGGPFLVMTYDNGGYGISNMDYVTVHEMGHIFRALDQYANSGCTCTETSGLLLVENQNCENSCLSNVPSIMRSIAGYTNDASAIDFYARGQLGWRDLDGDGINDAVDSTYNNRDTDNDGDEYIDYWDLDDDNDGFLDIIDVCQFTPGIAFYNGCPDTYPPIIGAGTYITPSKTYNSLSINVTITDPSGVRSAVLNYDYGNDGIEEGTLVMSNVGDTYSATIPAAGREYRNKNVAFYIAASDNLGYAGNSAKQLIFIENSKPTVDVYTPTSLNLTVNQEEIVNFSHSTLDLDGDNLTISWILDSVQQATTTTWIYSPNHSSAGIHNITLIISDGLSEASQEWRVNFTGCALPTNRKNITSSITFCAGNYRIPDGMTVSREGITVECNNGTSLIGDAGEIDGISVKSSSVTIKNCKITSFFPVIQASHIKNLTLQNNLFVGNFPSSIIELVNVSGARILNNNLNGSIHILHDSYNNLISNNIHGRGEQAKAAIYLYNSTHDNTISVGNFSATDEGVHIFNGTYKNTIEHNIFTKNKVSVLIVGSNDPSGNNTIRNNTIRGSLTDGVNYTGISISGATRNNLIHSNTVSNMKTCVSVKETSSNSIFNNNFLNCQTYATDANSSTWVKNYWDVFDEQTEGCTDSDTDTICDARYIIDEDSNDTSPSTIRRQYSFVVLYSITDLTVDENESAVLNASVIGRSNGEMNFTVNDSRFTGSGNSFTWKTGFADTGNYSVLITASDGTYQDTELVKVTVNDINRPLMWIVVPQNQTIQEDTNLTLQLNATDPDELPLFYSVNDTNFTVDNTGIITWQPPPNWYGNWSLNVRASTSDENLTADIIIQVTSVNDNPVLALINNFTVNESDLVTITPSATDVDNDQLSYSFTLPLNSSGQWQTTFNDSGTYQATITVSDENGGSDVKIVGITVHNDLDRDGVPDYSDDDDDNDGISDADDMLRGNWSDMDSNLGTLNLTIGNETNVSQRFTGTQRVSFMTGNLPHLEFNFNFSSATLDLSNITIQKQESGSKGSLIIRGFALPPGETKTAYIDHLDASLSTVCIHDADITTLAQVSNDCSQNNEVRVTCNGAAQNGYVCAPDGTRYRITGLQHSALIEQAPPNNNGGDGGAGGGGGGGGGGTAPVLPGAIEPVLALTPPTVAEAAEKPESDKINFVVKKKESTEKEENATIEDIPESSFITGAVTGARDFVSGHSAGILLTVAVLILIAGGYVAAHSGFVTSRRKAVMNMLKREHLYVILGVLVIVAAGVVIGFMPIVGLVIGPTDESTTEASFSAECLAQHIADGNIVYYRTGVHCEKCLIQEETLPEVFQQITTVDCAKNLRQCVKLGVAAEPSWVLNGKVHTGVLSLEELAQLSGCAGD